MKEHVWISRPKKVRNNIGVTMFTYIRNKINLTTSNNNPTEVKASIKKLYLCRVVVWKLFVAKILSHYCFCTCSLLILIHAL